MSLGLPELVQALNNALSTMLNEAPVNGVVENMEGQRIYADVSAHLAVATEGQSCVVLTVTEQAAVNLVQQWSGMEVNFEHTMVADAVGELLNVIVGTAQRLSREPYQFSVPVIAKGRGHEVRVLSSNSSERVVSKLSRMRGETIGLYLVHGDWSRGGPAS